METGKQIGEWKCIKVLGRGSFGMVFLLKNLTSHQFRAVKKFEIRGIDCEISSNLKVIGEMKTRWKKECQIMENLNCSYIVSTYSVPVELTREEFEEQQKNQQQNQQQHHNGLIDLRGDLLMMEYCTKGDLRMLLKRSEYISGLREVEVKKVLSHVSSAISYLHERNIIHRDIKPENILIQADDHQSNVYKLSDLGFAKNLSNSKSVCSTIVGTLQYLAPEIYNGKTYDRTVDYWSFGLIAFEIVSGMRPFLHGESPSAWIPLVEEKQKEVISIFRNDEGKILFSKEIPYFVHISGLLKMCLETWLRTMLQLDPALRGKRISTSNVKKDMEEITPIKMLSNILNTKFLSIKNPYKKLTFAIGNSTTICQLKDLITRDLGVPREKQMIITLVGDEVKDDEKAIVYYDKKVLYLVSNDEKLWKNPKLKMPKLVGEFIQNWDKIKDPVKLRLVWSTCIFFVQSELERVETIQSTFRAYLKWRNIKYISEIEKLQMEMEKSLASLDRILEFEDKLEIVQKNFDQNSPDYSQVWKNEKEKLVSKFTLESICQINSDLQNRLLGHKNPELFKLYGYILKSYENWQNPESASKDRRQMELLSQYILQFVSFRNKIIEKLLEDLCLTFEEIQKDIKKIEALNSYLIYVEELTSKIIKNRCERQSDFLSNAMSMSTSRMSTDSGKFSFSNNTSLTTSKEKDQLPQTIATHLKALEEDTVNLMTESQIIQIETESALKDAMQNAKTILDEKSKMDWQF